jgi:shikimate kinase
MKGITFIGMAGVGKSAIGRIVAPMIGWRFIDMDKLILEKQGITHHEYMKRNGGKALVQLEEAYTMELDLTDTVFAPPGSVVYSLKSMEKIKRESIVVYLEAEPEIILKHLGDKLYKNGIVGLEKKGLQGVMAERIPLYKKYADFTFSSGDQSKEDMARIVIEGLVKAGVKINYVFLQHK